MVTGTNGGPGASVVSRVVKVFIQELENVTTLLRNMVERRALEKDWRTKVVWRCNVEQVRDLRPSENVVVVI